MKYRYSKFLPGLTLMCDLLFLNIAVLIAIFILSFENARIAEIIILANLSWLGIAPFTEIYLTPRPLHLKYSIMKFLEVGSLHFAMVGCLIYLRIGGSIFSITGLLAAYAFFVTMVLIHRYILRLLLNYIRRRGYNLRNIIILGEKEASESLRQHISIHPEYGYDIIHNVFEKNIAAYSEQELEEILLKNNPDEIFICYSKLDQHMIDFMIRFGGNNGIIIKLVSDLVLNQKYVKVINYDSLPVLQLKHQPTLSQRLIIAKRGFDVVFSSSVIIASSPLLVTLYLVTKLTSKGPAWYKQERIGLNGRPFYIIKFRSMYVDAEEAGPQLATHGDPRVTPWGRIIRKTRLDELPQFWNVLKGDMSVVGPRPERQHFINQITERAPQYRLLQSIKPGITSIGQISYGYAENVDQMCERMQYDLLYLQNISFTADIRLIANTLKVMVQGKGK